MSTLNELLDDFTNRRIAPPTRTARRLAAAWMIYTDADMVRSMVTTAVNLEDRERAEMLRPGAFVDALRGYINGKGMSALCEELPSIGSARRLLDDQCGEFRAFCVALADDLEAIIDGARPGTATPLNKESSP